MHRANCESPLFLCTVKQVAFTFLASFSEPDQNFTAVFLGNDVTKHSSSSSWLAGHLHYVIIIGVLVLLIVVFMFATFCKMVAMQRQVERNIKMAPTEPRERTASEHHDQTTQTPRPLPRIPNGRAQTVNRLSRQGGDGAPTTVVHVADGPGSRPRSGTESPPFDNVDDPAHASTVPPARSSVRTRPKPYDIPPSHDRQMEIRSSVDPVSPRGPFLIESSQRSSEVKNFQTSTTVEEKNSERHTTVIEIKNPGNRQDSNEGSVVWKAHDHLGSFTGSNTNSESITPERGVVLGVNSLRRHLDREHQTVAAQARDRRPISAQHQETITAQVYYNTPAPCSEDSTLKDQFRPPSRDGGIPEHTALAGIRTSTRDSRKGLTPVSINMAEETTRL